MDSMTEKDRQLHKLRFPQGLEKIFRDEHYHKSLNQLRRGIIVGAFLYALFGILDARIFPAVQAKTWFVRYAVVCPLGLLTYLFTFTSRFKKYSQIAMCFLVFAGGAGIIAMIVMVRSPINYFHYAGLILVIMYAYTFSKLRFWYAAAASLSLVGLYEISALLITHPPMMVLLNDNLFYLAVNVIGMFSCYHQELYQRKDFLQTMTIRELEEKKHLMEKENIIRDLHDGIGGISTNIGLVAELGQKTGSLLEAKNMFIRIAELSQEAVNEIRILMRSFGTSPKTWQEMGAELRRQGGLLLEPHGVSFDIKMSVNNHQKQPGKFLWLNLFRIYRETLTIVLKYSQATSVKVELNVNRVGLNLLVHDDGVVRLQELYPSRGMDFIKTRAREIGGNVSITSNNGTMICLALPLPIQFANEPSQQAL
jgi:signal transduction histidine kinase